MVTPRLAQAASVRSVLPLRTLSGPPCIVFVALLAASCGASPDRCRSEAACPDGTVCEASGLCQPLALDPIVRVAQATWLLPSSSRAEPADADGGDVIRLGGSARGVLYLSFSPLPTSADEATAALVLTPHASYTRPSGALSVIVDRVRAPGASGTPPPLLPEAGTRALGPDSRGVIRVELTELLRDASRAGVRVLDLAVRVDGDASLRIASPASLERGRRPRLEVLVP